MSHDQRGWVNGGQPQMHMSAQKVVTVDVHEFIRTRDALASAYINLSSSFQHAVKSYLDHTQTVLDGDATLNVSHMLSAFAPLAAFSNPAQMAAAAMALQQNGNPNIHPDLKGEPEEKKKKKRNYKPRDPNAPKRPLTAYFRYLGDVRGSISDDLQKNPDRYEGLAGHPGDISRIATQRWTQMTDDEKLPYKTAYQEELKDYAVKAEEYNKAKGLSAEGDITGIPDMDQDAPAESPVTLGAVAKLDQHKQEDDDDDSSDSDKSASSEDSDEIDEPVPPPKAKKSALKKAKAGAAPSSSAPPQTFSSMATPVFSSINHAPAPPPASSPTTRKRKNDASEAEGTKKRGRKGAAAAESDPTPVASSPEASGKKEKKKRKARGES